MEGLVRCLAGSFKRNALAKFGDDYEVQDNGAGQKRVLARVVNHQGVVAAHHDFRRVLIHGTFAVAYTCF